MRHRLLIAALVAGLMNPAAWAQHMGGGHVGGGFGGHVGGGFGGHVGGGFGGHTGGFGAHPSSGVRPGFGGFRGPGMGFHGNGFLGPRPGIRPGFGRGPFFHNRPGFFPGWGWGWGGGWGWGWPWGWGYGYPWGYGDMGWYGYDNGYDNGSYVQYAPNQGYQSDYYSQTNPIEQDQQQEIDRLNDEVARLREDQQRERSTQPHAPSELTDLVFRDKHTEEVQNYAIVGQTVWILTADRARKIPISDLDLAATRKANEDRGVEFALPK